MAQTMANTTTPEAGAAVDIEGAGATGATLETRPAVATGATT